MTPLDMDALQLALREFAAARDWERFHTPKNLAMALIVEAAELLELFQWLDPMESLAKLEEPDFLGAVGDEIADVLIYAVRLADVTRINLPEVISKKLEKNAAKHPPS